MGQLNKIVKRVGVIATLTGVLFSTTGCEYLDLKKEIKDKDAKIVALGQEVQNVQAQKDALTITEESLATSLQVLDETGIPEFVTIDKKLNFPQALKLDKSVEDVNDSAIQVGSGFRFLPSENWVSKLVGTELKMNHPAKIVGSMKAVAINEMYDESYMKALLQYFFSGYPKTTIKYRKVFMDDMVSGMVARAAVKVDKKPHVFNVGFVMRAESAIIFIFDYEDNKSGVQQELVDLLLQTGAYGDAKVKIE